MPEHTDVTIDIDEIRLTGFGPFRPDVLAEVVERQLARLMDEEGLGALSGARIARAIQGGFGRGERR
jgi:hypothetical protein